MTQGDASGRAPWSLPLAPHGRRDPYRTRLLLLLGLSVGGAFPAVATPTLVGHVVGTIVARGSVGTIGQLAVVMTLVAVADAGDSLVTRWSSAWIGEGVILDLRTPVSNHARKMPVACFVRTRTGALVSRLNNDVLGAPSHNGKLVIWLESCGGSRLSGSSPPWGCTSSDPPS